MSGISVVVPVYNVEKYLGECLESLINQTFRDIEIICINDGSSDNSFNILEEYAKKDSRIIVINQKNSGVSNARNKGVDIASKDYIAFIDSDDWVDKNYLEELYNAITKNNCDIAVATIIRKRPNSQKYRVHYTEEKIYSTLEEKINACQVPICCYVWGKLFKTNLVKKLKFRENVYFEDVIYTPQILDMSDKLVTVPNVVYWYRVNQNSIVKKPTKKKQFDSYSAKKFAIEYLEKRGITFSRKTRDITKEIKYFLGIPILKTKECDNILTMFLFGFIPVFKKNISKNLKYRTLKKFLLLKKLDSHFYIELFKYLKISIKNNDKFKYFEAKEYGLEKQTRSTKLIVSLTSFPQRIKTLHITINTLLNQTIKPDKLILWLADSQFPNKESDLPQNLLKLKDFGLEIKWCEDLKSYKKLIPALKEFPNDIIVSADDDLYYQKDWLESLYSAYLKEPSHIYTRRACGVNLKDNVLSITPHYANTNYNPTFLNQLMGGAGTLYPPHTLHEDVFNVDLIKNLIPTHDDIYFWIMAVLKGTKIKLIKNKNVNIYNIKESQETALCKQQSTNEGMRPSEAFYRILKHYPQAAEILKEESICQK